MRPVVDEFESYKILSHPSFLFPQPFIQVFLQTSMSTVIAVYILGAGGGPIPEDPLRADCDMYLSKYINSGLRLKHKLAYV